MTDQIRCEIYHAFEGHCCPDGEQCPLKPRPPAAIEVVRQHSIIQHGALMTIVAAAVSAAVFVAFLATERDLERWARANQESYAGVAR